MGGLATTGLIAAALAALWILIAAILSIAAARRIRAAQTVVSTAHNLQNLVDLSPARPLVVRADGSVEADPRLLREIGLADAPSTLADFGGTERGLDPADVAELEAKIRETAMSGDRKSVV